MARVLLEPGRPESITGIRLRIHVNRTKILSVNARFLAVPNGNSILSTRDIFSLCNNVEIDSNVTFES